MKNRFKGLIVLMISVALVASLLAGCGTTKSEAPEEKAPTAADEPSTEESAVGEPAAADGEGEAMPADEPVTDTYEEYAEDSMASSAKAAPGALDEAAPAGEAAGDAGVGEPDIDTGEEDTDAIVDPEMPDDDAEAGILTASRWNDHANWGFFMNLVKNGTFKFPSFGIDPRNRFAVTVNDEKGKPLPNCKVALMSSTGGAVWTSVTDKNGVAYLFYTADDNADRVEVTGADGTKQSAEVNLPDVSGGKKGSDKKEKKSDNDQGNGKATDEELTVTLAEKAKKNTNMDIMFIMDATGSMSDEMAFLQKDFAKIAKDTHKDGMKFAANFYRDEGDDYVTKLFDFTDDISKLQGDINNQYADGGGDTPEAVDTILDESINKSSWRDDSTKLAFLIFDAPPHDGKAVEASINASIKKASEMGIRVIPVVSSNAERDTEIFGRALAICTNGEYVFLTDDSGVGDSHLEPIVGDHEVKPLYDIIVEIIKEYRK